VIDAQAPPRAQHPPPSFALRAVGRPSGGPRVFFAVLLFVVAFALRFAVARLVAGEPVWDGHYYDFGAHRIAEGHGYSDDRTLGGPDGPRLEWHPWCHYPVGYSAYLAFFYWLLGPRAWVLHLANATCGALVAVVVYLLAHEGLTERRARLGGILTALHPGLVLYSALAMSEMLAALTVMAAFWIAIYGTRAWRGPRGLVAGALVLGVSALVRPQALLCVPFLALVVPKRDLVAMARAAAIAGVVALVPVLPWTARNCAVMDGCALVSTNAGWNLAIGSFPRATGRFETLRSSDGCREVTGQVQQDRCWLSYGIANIKATPSRWLGLIPAKLSNTFDHESFAVEYLREARQEDWPEPRRVAWRNVLSALHRMLVIVSPIAFIGLIVPRRKGERSRRETIAQGAALLVAVLAASFGLAADRPTFWPIVLGVSILPWLPLPGRPRPEPALLLPSVLVLTTALAHAIFFGDDRYHMVITPALCLFAAAALREPEPQNTRGADTEVCAPPEQASS
jgi:4-amino-4-deoxy-L-arabinose transferase-like glycosyltransferase